MNAQRDWVSPVLGCLSVALATVFWRGHFTPFDLTKATVLWIAAIAILGFGGYRLIAEEFVRVPRSERLALGALVFAGVLSALLSVRPLESVFGHAGRHSGLLTLLSVVALLLLARSTPTERGLRTLVPALVVSGSIVACFGLLQHAGGDPFNWGEGSFESGVFSSMGNPNTAAGLLAVTFPTVIALALKRESRTGARVVVGLMIAVFGVAIAATESIQGVVAAAPAIAVLLAVAVKRRSDAATLAVVALLGATVVVTTVSRPSLLALLVGCVLGGVAALIKAGENVNARVPLRRVGLVAIMVAGLIASGVALSRWEALAAEVIGGFAFRPRLWAAALRLLVENPISGVGLDMFVYEAPRQLAADYQMLEGAQLSSSAHNVFLGFFASGGFPLGLAYMVLVALTARGAWRLLRESTTPLALLSVCASWGALQVQSLVSVEHVALQALNFLLMGTILRASERDVNRSGSAASARPRRAEMLASACIALGVCFLVTLPFRSATAASEGYRLLLTGTAFSVAAEELEKSVRLAPWDGVARAQFAEALMASGDQKRAAAVALKAAEDTRFYSLLAPRLAYIVALSGDVAGADLILWSALESDPHSPRLLSTAVELYTGLALGLEQEGDLQLARQMAEKALAVDPSAGEALSLISRVSRAVK